MAADISCLYAPIDRFARSRIISYVRERRCPDGGYCFYRLDEPNAGDTFYALQTLSLLGEKLRDGRTAGFLKGLQGPDGSYSSYSAALFAGRGLRLLDDSPNQDVTEFISLGIPCLDPKTQVIETFSLFDPLLTWISLFSLYQIPLHETWRERVIDSILRYQHFSGGFGSPIPTLRDTWQASEVLLTLDYPRENLGITRFIQSCEDPEFGYLGRPGTRPPYLEHLYAGLRLSSLLENIPRYPGACGAFLKRCIHQSGGFVRSMFGGSPTLEFTARATESLVILGDENIAPGILVDADKKAIRSELRKGSDHDRYNNYQD
jgi:hypothetical protein